MSDELGHNLYKIVPQPDMTAAELCEFLLAAKGNLVHFTPAQFEKFSPGLQRHLQFMAKE